MNTDKHGSGNAVLLASLLLAGIIQGCVSKQRALTDSKSSETVATNAPVETNRPKEEPATLKQAARLPSAPFSGEGWKPLSDGKTLAGWKDLQFAGHGETECVSNMIVLDTGDPFTGIAFTNPFPKTDYEIGLDAMRLSGSDFFCGLTFPVGDSFCSLIVGGWGGSLLGLSSIDGMDASENETTKYVNFENGKWYRIRLRVTKDRIEGWLDKEKLIDVNTKGRRISLRAGEIEMCVPLGICSWQTAGAIREIRVRNVSEPADPPKRY